jgi:outer membrane protein OmpA-like peptidoglycan-associated protein
MNRFSQITLMASIVALTACASAPKRVAELDAARVEYEAVASDPLAREAAASRLETAEQRLRQADAALAARQPTAVVQQEAYLARRNAQIAAEQIGERRARKAVEEGQAARDRVLLDARSQEAAKAREQAELARAQAAAATSQAAAANSEADKLRGDLAALQAKPTDRGMVLTLGDVLFDTGKSELKAGAMGTVERVGDFLRANGAYHLIIEGHTDSTGSDDFNLQLSDRRAQAVRGALQSRGVTGDRIVARGLGETYPIASNDDASGRQQNRRVEIVFSDAQGAFPPSAERSARSGE